MKTQIIYEDKDILVVYKPGGFPSQSARVTQPDVMSELCGYLKTDQIFPVHRLDQPVEGLMAVAKTKSAAGNLSNQLADGNLKKTYLAVVCGQQPLKDGDWTEITDYLLKDAKNSRAEIVKGNVSPKQQKATLSYRSIKAGEENTALVEIRLKTGRFHQIRAQMAHHGMPLLGDAKYGSEESRALSERMGVKDVSLCAYKLSFLHPTNKKEMNFQIKPEKAVFNSYEL